MRFTPVLRLGWKKLLFAGCLAAVGACGALHYRNPVGSYEALGSVFLEAARAFNGNGSALLLSRDMFVRSILRDDRHFTLTGNGICLTYKELYKHRPEALSKLEYPEKAGALSERGLHLLMKCATCYYAIGQENNDLAQLSKAENFLLKVLDRSKANEDDTMVLSAQEYLGRTYTAMGNYKKAEPMLAASVKTLDKVASQTGDWEVRARKRDWYRHWGCPYQALGELYAHMGKTDATVKNYIRAADAEDGRSHPQYIAALYLFAAGEYDLALNYIDKALELQDEESIERKSQFQTVKGFVRLMQRDYESARKLFDEALKRDREIGAAVGLGHLHIIDKDPEKALEVLNSVRDKAEANVKTGGEKSFFDKTLNVIMYDYDRLVFEMACLGLGWAHANQNMHAQSLTHYESVLSWKPNSLLALMGKGNAYNNMDKLEEAEEIFNQILTLYPNNAYALAEMGVIKLKRGENTRAEIDFKKALAADDRNFTCPYEGLGLVYLKWGRLSDAEENFKKSIEINPDIEYKKYNGLARIYMVQGKLKEARALLEKSKSNYPYNDEADELLEDLDRAERLEKTR